MRCAWAILCVLALLVACVPVQTPPVLKNLAKSDTAFFVEAARTELDQRLSELLVKLYRRNPSQMPSNITLELRLLQLKSPRISLSEFNETSAEALIRLAFEPEFQGDRVFAFSAGLQDMVNRAFDGRREFLLLDDFPDPQFIYNSARNIEAAAYLLRTRRDPSGHPYLYADGVQDDVLNASYSQILGGLISVQDTLATTLAMKEQRTINAVTRGVASTLFLPVGF
ncbi:MAG: hypothetical protein EBS77_03650 [Gammaproteobacteria bacterium]|nr:hypothetical protein [Gammaproteobacteria bacterium]